MNLTDRLDESGDHGDTVTKSENNRKAWFLAQLKPNCQDIAARNLARQQIESFLPMEELSVQRRGRFVSTTRSLFPGYIFVSFDLNRGLWRKISSTQGITRLVGFGNKPAPVPHGLMEELQARCDAKGRLRPADELAPGDKVSIAKGPFTDLMAKIISVEPNRRAWVLMDLMGTETRVSLGLDQLRPTTKHLAAG